MGAEPTSTPEPARWVATIRGARIEASYRWYDREKAAFVETLGLARFVPNEPCTPLHDPIRRFGFHRQTEAGEERSRTYAPGPGAHNTGATGNPSGRFSGGDPKGQTPRTPFATAWAKGFGTPWRERESSMMSCARVPSIAWTWCRRATVVTPHARETLA